MIKLLLGISSACFFIVVALPLAPVYAIDATEAKSDIKKFCENHVPKSVKSDCKDIADRAYRVAVEKTDCKDKKGSEKYKCAEGRANTYIDKAAEGNPSKTVFSKRFSDVLKDPSSAAGKSAGSIKVGNFGSAASLGIPNFSGDEDNLLQTILGTILFIASILSVVFVMIGGYKYMTSNGNATNTKSAKDTITYALIGLAVSILAQVMVGFVLTRGPQ